MRFLVISGRSGSGKSSALHLLEDEGFTCIDNIPVTLLPSLITYIKKEQQRKFAIGIDARNIDGNLSQISGMLRDSGIPEADIQVLYLDTQTEVLLKRFSETRRKHPLSDAKTGLSEALDKERDILVPMVDIADIIIDTSSLNLHQLRSTIRRLVVGTETQSMAIMVVSFGFKYGAPTDADFVFDVRSLPNPHWEPSLRLKTGLEKEVKAYLSEQARVASMIDDIATFLEKWIPSFQQNNRSYLTIAIGCTGGMHRSVYISECLCERLKKPFINVQVRHRQLTEQSKKID